MATSQKLTLGQGIGIGVVVGFVVGFIMALLLLGIVLLSAKDPHRALIPKISHFFGRNQSQDSEPEMEYLPPHRVIVLEDPDCEPVTLAREQTPTGELGKWKPNRSFHSWKDLPARMEPMRGGDCIKTATYFRRGIEQLQLQCIRGKNMPEVLPSLFNEDQLTRLAGEPANGGTWAGSLSNLETRGGAVSCFLAQVLFKHMDPLCDVDQGFIPPEIATLYQIMYRKAGPFKPEPTRSERVYYETLAVWRETINIMFGQTYNIEHNHLLGFTPDDARKERTFALVDTVIDALKLKTLNVKKSTQTLEYFMKEAFEGAACCALALFCQPSVWEYEWVSSEPGFMIFPEVRLRWDEDCIKYTMPATIDKHCPKPLPKWRTS